MIDAAKPKSLIARKARPIIETALSDTRVVLIAGPRQAGKTTLARQFSGPDRPYITLDDAGALNAAKTDLKTTCHFGYSGPLTEANHLASISYRLGKKLEWDPVNLKCKNAPEADRLLHREYRKGWDLKA